jgi:hypothetical protein
LIFGQAFQPDSVTITSKAVRLESLTYDKLLRTLASLRLRQIFGEVRFRSRSWIR